MHEQSEDRKRGDFCCCINTLVAAAAGSVAPAALGCCESSGCIRSVASSQIKTVELRRHRANSRSLAKPWKLNLATEIILLALLIKNCFFWSSCMEFAGSVRSLTTTVKTHLEKSRQGSATARTGRQAHRAYWAGRRPPPPPHSISTAKQEN
jgi:hypothetical protein